MRAAEMTWPEYRDRIRTCAVVVPVGALEPHGPHLPLATDTIIAEYLADQLAEQVDSLVLPAISYGYRTNPIRMGGEFSGTLDIGARTLRDHVYDLLTAAYREGARRFVVLHAAYANVAITYDAVAGFVNASPDARVLAASWWDFASEGTRNAIARETGVDRADDNHAALVETSLVMHMSPGVVREHLVTDDTSPGRVRYTVLPIPESLCTATGIVYCARGASAAIGKRLTDEVVKAMVAAVQQHLSTEI
ncbi:MAG: creatininase family protein [Pseudonocardiaceae bacterium]